MMHIEIGEWWVHILQSLKVDAGVVEGLKQQAAMRSSCTTEVWEERWEILQLK